MYTFIMRNQTNRLKDILNDTREWAEEIAEEYEEDYTNDLCGLCAIVSKELFIQLSYHGYKCKIAYNAKHCFVLCKNRVFDLTATQFGKPRIYIFSTKGNIKGKWKIDKVFTNANDLSDYQEEKGWFQSQIYLE